jgi:hypothetical protein
MKSIYKTLNWLYRKANKVTTLTHYAVFLKKWELLVRNCTDLKETGGTVRVHTTLFWVHSIQSTHSHPIHVNIALPSLHLSILDQTAI